METPENKLLQDFYYSAKQSILYHLLNEDDAYPRRIERRTVAGKAYTCVVDTGKPPTGIFDDYLLVGTATTADTKGDGYW